MTNTNQLIEEFKDKCNRLSNMGTTGINTGGFYTGNPEAEDWHLSEDFMVEWLIKALSQTEQECYKKWMEKIRGKRRDNVFVPSHSPSMHGGLVCRACGGQEDCGCEYYNEAIDDLLNNK